MPDGQGDGGFLGGCAIRRFYAGTPCASMESEEARLKVGSATIGELCFSHPLPKKPQELDQRIEREPAEDAIEAGPAPRPHIGCMKNKRQRNMPSKAKT